MTAKEFLEAMKPLEDATGAVDPGSDNCILFTVTKGVIAELLKDDTPESLRVCNVLLDRKLSPGVYCRHRGEDWPSSWDDHLAVAVYGNETTLASEILAHAKASNWTWGTNWLGRIPLFRGTVIHCGGDKLSPWEQWLVAGAYLGNLWEARQESSGKILLWLASTAFEGAGYWPIRLAIAIWIVRMERLYPAGPKELLGVYHGTTHPFAVYGPSNW